MQQPQQYPQYPYYGQPMYHPQTPYMGPSAPPPPGPSHGYPPFYGPPNPQPPQPAPQHPNPPAPSPYSFDAAAYATPQNGPPITVPSRRHRRNQTTPATAPLKSAMKKTMAVFNTPAQFHNPFSSQQQNQNQNPTHMPRPRVYSNASQHNREELDRASLLHMILSFHGYNELHIEHILPLALDELRKNIWPLWSDGLESDTVVGHTCIVKFRNSPWDLSGPNARRAYKFIVEFFRLFQRRGYTYHTAVGLTTTSPRLLFQVTQPDQRIVFFIAYFSQEGRRLTLIDPPNHIDISIGARLKSLFPRKIQSDDVVEDNIRVIEIKRKPNHSPEVEPSVFLIHVLKILIDLGFELEATLPLGRRGALGKRIVRELFIFKGVPP